ncbi:Uncharacterised protein [Mycobacteroides abscessus subsp. abscessus]|nr:Uncharacterised protein [Mycobacteroides abscessus subsp. abscessus]
MPNMTRIRPGANVGSATGSVSIPNMVDIALASASAPTP